MGHQRDAGAGRLTARRRDVIALTAGATVAWPLGAHGEQKPSPTIGFLSGGQNDPRSQTVDGLGQGLAKAGYVVGRNLNIEYRWAEGQFNRLPALAADLASRRVALIATVTLPAAMAAKAASPTTPIVFVIGEDPVKAGLVASFNRPAGNATGVSDFINQIVAKRLELLQQAVPAAKLIGLLVNPNNPNTQVDANEAGTAAKVLGQKLLVLNVASDRELRGGFRDACAGACRRPCGQYRPILGPRPRPDHLVSRPLPLARGLPTT